MKKTKKVAVEPYIASIKIFGKTYESKGQSVIEAVNNLKIEGVAKGVCILTISKGEAKRNRILTAPQTFRLFNGGRVMREVALKGVSLLFDNL